MKILDRWRNETRVAFLAHHDALTGLYNRAALIEKIEDACARNRRWGEEFNVLMMDLDRFKQVNDTFGHPAGDDLLRQVADRLSTTLRETDILARLGGDEFAIVQINDANQSEAAENSATRIIAVIGEPFSIKGNAVNIGASIGIALAPQHGIHADDLLKMADLALYHAKSLGRNRYATFDPALGRAAADKHILESELRQALMDDDLEVHFQPIVDSKTFTICSAEALISVAPSGKGSDITRAIHSPRRGVRVDPSNWRMDASSGMQGGSEVAFADKGCSEPLHGPAAQHQSARQRHVRPRRIGPAA